MLKGGKMRRYPNPELLRKVLKNKELDKGNLYSSLKYDSLIVLNKLDKKDYTNDYLNSHVVKNVLVGVYEDILAKNVKRKTFGPGTFVGKQGKLNAIILTRHLFEEKFHWDIGKILHKMDKNTLDKNKLRTIRNCFKYYYELIIACYPMYGLKPYYFKNAKEVWIRDGKIRKDLIRDAVRELVYILCKNKKKYPFKRLPQWINYSLFQKHILPFEVNLSYMLNLVYKNSPIDAVIDSFPELKLKPYYFKNAPKRYWVGKEGKEHAIEASSEFVDILTNPTGAYQWSVEELYGFIRYKSYFKPILPFRAKLGGMLQVVFRNSPSAPLRLVQNLRRK